MIAPSPARGATSNSAMVIERLRHQPFRTRSRVLMVLAGWLALAAMQGALLVGVARGVSDGPAVFALYGSIALAWALMTPAIAALTQSRSMRRAGWVKQIAVHLSLFVGAGIVDAMTRRAMVSVLGGTLPLPWYGTLLYFADRTFVSYLLIVLVARTLGSHDLFVARQRNALALQAQLARARLTSLEEQLHPHFLFNTLGAVTELTHEAPARAARMLRQLASVLDFTLERRSAEVSLREEVAALEPYLEVQRTRFADWLTIDCEIDDAAGDALLPPLVLQPLVENSIRHGLSHRMVAGQILITARQVDEQLVIQVRDNGVGLRAPRLPESRGIGMSNVRERLASLYGDDAELRLYDSEHGETIAEVSVPFRFVRDASADQAGLQDDADGEEAPILPAFMRRHRALTVFAAWGAWGLLWTQQSIAYLAFRNRLADRGLLDIALRDFATSMLWAALTPLMLLCVHLVPLRRSFIALRLALHAGVAVLIAMLHIALAMTLVHRAPVEIRTAEGISSVIWGVLAYMVVVTIAHHETIREWLRARELASVRLRVSLAEAEFRMATARSKPRELLASLESIAQSVLLDPEGADSALARLGDRLRADLDAGVPA
ncbi:MAG: histidine kinase [Gemmatimonadaceae bacterium]